MNNKTLDTYSIVLRILLCFMDIYFVIKCIKEFLDIVHQDFNIGIIILSGLVLLNMILFVILYIITTTRALKKYLNTYDAENNK